MNKIVASVAILIAIILVALIIYYVYKYYTGNNSSVSAFTNAYPKNLFQALVKELGNPTTVNNVAGGNAQWTKLDTFDSVILRDESIVHPTPTAHCDCLYTTIALHIPPEQLANVLSVSDSLYYDQLKNKLTSRCGSMPNNVVSLYLAAMIVSDPTNADEYANSYSDYISSAQTNSFYTDLKTKLTNLVKTNQASYGALNPSYNCTLQPSTTTTTSTPCSNNCQCNAPTGTTTK